MWSWKGYETIKDLTCEKEKIKRNNDRKQYKNVWLWLYYKRRHKKGHDPKWPEIPDHPYRILIVEGSGPRNINALFNLINNEPDNDKIHTKKNINC